MYSVFISKNEDLLRQYAQQTGFPENKISIVTTVINPTCAEK